MCAFSLEAGAPVDATPVVARSALGSRPSELISLFVESSLMLFGTSTGDAYQCNANDCTRPTRIGGTVDSMTVNSRSMYVLIDGEIWSAERVPLRESR